MDTLTELQHLADRLYILGDFVEQGIYPNTLASELKAASDAVASMRQILIDFYEPSHD